MKTAAQSPAGEAQGVDLSHPAPCHVGTEGEKEAMGILCDPILQPQVPFSHGVWGGYPMGPPLFSGAQDRTDPWRADLDCAGS